MLIGTCASTAVFAAASASSGESLIWRGDITTARGVVTDIAKAWEKAGHSKIEVQSFNTASGLEAVSRGSADLAGSARGSSGSAQDAALTFTPVAWDALVMVVHPSNPVTSLTLTQLHDIYYGKITNWKDVGGKDEPIDLYAVASPGDGVEYSLRRLLFGRGNQPVAAPRLYVNTAKLEEGVTVDPMGMGVATLASTRGDNKVKLLHIGGSAPTTASVADGSYPLYTPLYLITSASSPKAADAQAFVDFVGSDKAKAILRQHQLVPYQDGIALASMDAGRRSKILAEVGAKPVTEIATASAPAAASPRVAATSGELAAIQAGNPKKARAAAAAAAAAEPGLNAVSGSAITVTAAESAPNLDHVVGDAITVASAGSRGSDFSRVTSDAYVAYSKPARMKKAIVKSGAALEQIPVVEKAPAAVKTAKASKTYKVAAGETLYSIARKHSVDVAQVRAWNHLKDNTVHPGQTLIVGNR